MSQHFTKMYSSAMSKTYYTLISSSQLKFPDSDFNEFEAKNINDIIKDIVFPGITMQNNNVFHLLTYIYSIITKDANSKMKEALQTSKATK